MMLKSAPASPSLLILRFSSIGDIVLTTAAMEFIKIRWPELRLVLVTKKGFTSMFVEHPFLDQIIEFEGFNGEFWRQVHSVNPKAILDLHNNLRSFRVKLKFWNLPSQSINKRGLDRWLYIKNYRKTGVDSVVNRNIETAFRLLSSAWVQRLNTALFVTMPLNFDEVQVAGFPGLSMGSFSQRLEELPNEICGVISGKNYGVLHISATYNTKRVSLHVWKYILEHRSENLVITGGKEDVLNAEALMALAESSSTDQSPFQVLNLVGKTDLQQTSAVIQQAAWFVGGDTGFTHVAAAYGIPHITVWGNTSPDLGFVTWLGNKYDGEIQQHLEVSGLSCRPCSKLGYNACPQGHFSCMKLQNLQELESKLQFLRDRNK